MKLGILGGTFNPPHKGHLNAARNVQASLNLDKVLFVPTNLPPHKEIPEGSATTQQRLDMLRLAVQELPFADVSPLEIERGGRSYTVDTVRQMKNHWANADIYVIIGTDMLLTMDTWHMPHILVNMCSLAVVARSDEDREAIEEAAQMLREEWNARVYIIDSPVIEVSSTMIRETSDPDLLLEYVPDTVADYIKKHRLYQYSL